MRTRGVNRVDARSQSTVHSLPLKSPVLGSCMGRCVQIGKCRWTRATGKGEGRIEVPGETGTGARLFLRMCGKEKT